MAQEIKYIANPTQFLIDSGLLFSINKNVLHPLGLAMAVNESEEGTEGVRFGEISIWDCRKDPEGILYGEKTFTSGAEKHEKFMEEFGLKKLEQREENLGYLVQELPDPYLVRDGEVSLVAITNPETQEAVRFKVEAKWLSKTVDGWFGMPLIAFLKAHGIEQASHIYQLAKNSAEILSEEPIELKEGMEVETKLYRPEEEEGQ